MNQKEVDAEFVAHDPSDRAGRRAGAAEAGRFPDTCGVAWVGADPACGRGLVQRL
jgi:hypothetical protein